MKPRGSSRAGLVAVMAALALPVLLSMAAMALEGGLLLAQKRHARATADAAAMAAACVLYEHFPQQQGRGPYSSAQQAALNIARANGYANSGGTGPGDTLVEVNLPPRSGPYADPDRYPGCVEVLVTFYQERYFSKIWGSEPLPVRARAVARGAWVDSNIGVLLLDYTGQAALNAQGNGAFTETGGKVVINSNNSAAVTSSGNATMVALEFDVTGGTKISNSSSFTTAPEPNRIFTGVHPTPDPLAYLPQPGDTANGGPPVPPNGALTSRSLGGGQVEYVLSPGRFSNLPTFGPGDVVIFQQASANQTVDKFGGIYYLEGGGLRSTGASILMDPSTSGGVLIYNNPVGDASSERIQITGFGGNASTPAGTVNLAPLTDGPYTGLALWQNRGSSVPALIEGSGSFSIQGTIYMANALLNVNGNGKSSSGESTGSYVDDAGNTIAGSSRIGSQYVTKDLSIGGNGNVTIRYSGPKAANVRILTLVE